MAELTVIVPSRGRPEQARALIDAFRTTCTADTVLLFSVDDTDERLPDYIASLPADGRAAAVTGDNRNMVQALNRAAGIVESAATGFMGDDHCPRTHGWDTAYLEALHGLGTGLVYGDDLLQRANLPTQVAMTTDIVRVLGWMAPPTLTHLYVDNFWKDLGQAAGCLRYLPDVVIEHRHPVAGKAEWDANYARVNDAGMYQRDALAYQQFVQAGHLHDAVAAVKALKQ